MVIDRRRHDKDGVLSASGQRCATVFVSNSFFLVSQHFGAAMDTPRHTQRKKTSVGMPSKPYGTASIHVPRRVRLLK